LKRGKRNLNQVENEVKCFLTAIQCCTCIGVVTTVIVSVTFPLGPDAAAIITAEEWRRTCHLGWDNHAV